MRKQSIEPKDLIGVFPVPPLARRRTAGHEIDFEASRKIADHIMAGGPSRLMYGGNAFLYHITLAEYGALLDWLTGFPDSAWCIPSAGPSYGRAMDQAPMLRGRGFPAVMLLPCGDPRDAFGLERGYREFAEGAATPLIVYVKEENNFGGNIAAGIEAIGRLVDDGVCIAIKYAVVRKDPAKDDYLTALLDRVDRKHVISGIGERPAIVHLEQWKLSGFTTGSGCIAPRLSQTILEMCLRGEFREAEAVRAKFLAFEDIRDAWGPAKVLHAGVAEAGIAETGPTAPFVSELSVAEKAEAGSAARELMLANRG